MKIVAAGLTGFIGEALLTRLLGEGHTVTLLARNPENVREKINPKIHLQHWDGKTAGEWTRHVDGADAVLNFAGESLGAKRWTAEQKKRIVGSRIDATRALVDAMRAATRRPSVLVNASAVGYYGSVEEGEVTEDHPRGAGFLSETCERWENEASEAVKLGVRLALLRTGVVLGPGGALTRMTLPFKLFLGGPIGNGRQWFSWVHREDVVNVVLLALRDQRVSGPVNVAAPDCVTMKQFCHAVGRALRRPSWAPVPAFVLKLALGEMAEMLLTGQRVVPTRLQQLGYTFRFSNLDAALHDIFEK
jgi:uncharacterized protein (TIGR01777 family)